jgi:hypothetical protein
MTSKFALPRVPHFLDSRVPAARRRGARRAIARAALIAAIASSAACGGGGSGDTAAAADADSLRRQSQSAPPPPAPVEPAPAPVDSSTVDYACYFTSAWQDCSFGEQAKVAGRATLVTVGGVTAVRLHTEPGDNNVAGSGSNERNDLTTSQATSDGYEGKEHWWAHSILFPDDYVDPPESSSSSWNFGIVADFHNTTNGAGQANFQVNAMPATAIASDRPTGLSFKIAYGDQTSPTEAIYPIGPVVRNQWYNFVYHVKWTSGTDGFFDAWVNGVQMMAYRGPTLYAGQGVYFKLANYHTPHGQPSSVIHARVIRSATPL